MKYARESALLPKTIELEDAMNRRTAPCPAEYTLSVIGGRGKALILWKLFQGEQRFSDLFRVMNGPTQKMLTQQLRELERDGLVHRQVYAQVPPTVEYSLTPLGMSLKPVVNAMSLLLKPYAVSDSSPHFHFFLSSTIYGSPAQV
jgi:DNA-binding HxlR family transcriptional regulator